MDYKKLIILNLSFLLILGKILLFVFGRMQRNLKKIDIDNNHLLTFICDMNVSSNLIGNESKMDLDPNLSFENLQNFSKSLSEILKEYDFITDIKDKNKIDQNTLIKLEEIKLKVITINKFVAEVKSRKLKIFCLILSLIFLLNYLVLSKFSPYEKYKKIKEKVKSILVKLNKISQLNAKDIPSTENVNIQSIKEEKITELDNYDIITKKNN